MILKDLIKQKETKLGIAAAIAFQVIFVIVWLTGYTGVDERTNKLTIGVVNDDLVIGEEIAKQMEGNNTFKFIVMNDLSSAEKILDNRDIQMLIHLPSDLTDKIQENELARINYYINQSVPTLEKQVMEQAAAKLNEAINEQAKAMIQAELAEQLPKNFAAQSDQPEVVEQIAREVVAVMQENSLDKPIQETMIKMNNKEGFINTMIPLLIILASYIGAMLVSQHLQLAATKLGEHYRTFPLFIWRQCINGFVAILISSLTSLFIVMFSIDITESLFTLWFFQTVLVACFLVLSQMFVFLFGNLGMVFNIALTALQLVSSGAIVPRELLADFYQKLGSVLPATYGVNGYLSLIYGGGELTDEVKVLMLMIGIILVITVAAKLLIELLKISWNQSSKRKGQQFDLIK